jgi:predicted DNA binding protein
MLKAIVRVKPTSSWAIDVSMEHDAPIIILDCIAFGKEGGQGLVEIEGDDSRKERIIKGILEHPDVHDLEIINSSEGKIVASVIANNWVACSTILKSNCFLKRAWTSKKGGIEWEILAIDETSLERLVNALKATGCKVELVKKEMIKDQRILTKRQESIVKTALEKGYYDFPRKTTGRELSKSLNISPSTLSEILQRAERKLIDYYLTNKP